MDANLISYYKRNPERFVEDILNIKLNLYQKFALRMIFYSDNNEKKGKIKCEDYLS